MCILTFYRPGVTPDLVALHAGAIVNPDGHGYAVVADDRILVGHGLDPDRVIDEFATVRAEFPDTPALFHSRLATHGTVSVDNCHPFIVGGDERTVLAHNGILPTLVQPPKGDLRSDTRIAAEDFLPTQPFGSLDAWTGRSGLEQWLRTDKMVLLTIDPAYRHTAYVFNEHLGHHSDDGAWYSNTSYQWPLALLDGNAEDAYCGMCGEFDPERPGTHCVFCGYCQDCIRPFPHCECPGYDGLNRYADLDYYLDQVA
ncbi:class II glutamine amidotransferase [Nocardia mexicana]|uniref:Glutamine amidotransferase n=1 Tax=Nocardia mexicana TaxID=279262 RepID=A0A370GS28_9NOCA|nr:class II glutamine amidotransferase [Nocardia mexicana]RDI45304.1 glutamine amidotransferase [Nocardia mexicana]